MSYPSHHSQMNTFQCKGLSRGAPRYLLRREGVVPNDRTRCAITRCREIMTPQLSIVKTRFAKASLRPRCARHRSWGATCLFPNACVGYSPTQCLRGILTYPMLALVVKLPNERYGPSGRSPYRVGIHSSTIRGLLRLVNYCPGDPCSANLHGDPSTARWRSSTIRVHELSGISPQRTWLLVRPSFLQSGHLCGADPSIVVTSPVPQVWHSS